MFVKPCARNVNFRGLKYFRHSPATAKKLETVAQRSRGSKVSEMMNLIFDVILISKPNNLKIIVEDCFMIQVIDE